VDPDYNYSEGDLATVFSSNIFKPLTQLNNPVLTPNQKVKFSGIGQLLDLENSMVFPILSGEERHQSRSVDCTSKCDKISSTTGQQITLVSGY
jgi:hypothetical protein